MRVIDNEAMQDVQGGHVGIYLWMRAQMRLQELRRQWFDDHEVWRRSRGGLMEFVQFKRCPNCFDGPLCEPPR